MLLQNVISGDFCRSKFAHPPKLVLSKSEGGQTKLAILTNKDGSYMSYVLSTKAANCRVQNAWGSDGSTSSSELPPFVIWLVLLRFWKGRASADERFWREKCSQFFEGLKVFKLLFCFSYHVRFDKFSRASSFVTIAHLIVRTMLLWIILILAPAGRITAHIVLLR